MLVYKLASSSNQGETQLPVERKRQQLEEISVRLKPLGISLMSINGCLWMPWSRQHASNWRPFKRAQRSGLPGFTGYILHLAGLSFAVMTTQGCPAERLISRTVNIIWLWNVESYLDLLLLFVKEKKISRQEFRCCVIYRKKWELRGITEAPAQLLIKHQTEQ